MAEDVTLDDVARKSGVSRATASRAMNGRDGVRDDVRERVRMIAKAVGYRPNRAAKNLAGGRASVIGLVLGREELGDDPYATSLVQAVAKAADHYDEGLMLLLDSTKPSESVRNLLSDGLVDGVIVSVVAVGERWIEELLDANVPTVLVGAHPRRSDVAVVDVENRESTATVVGHMIDTGAKRVGTITGRPDRVDASLRLEGFRLAHERRSIPVDESLIVNGNFSRRYGYQIADTLLDKEPDAIFCANDETALGVLYRAIERGIDIPGRMSLAGFDGTSANEVTGPRLTTVEQPFGQLALRAVESLIANIAGEQDRQVQLVVPVISYGETTRARIEDPESQ